MKRTTFQVAIACCLALSLGVSDTFASGIRIGGGGVRVGGGGVGVGVGGGGVRVGGGGVGVGAGGGGVRVGGGGVGVGAGGGGVRVGGGGVGTPGVGVGVLGVGVRTPGVGVGVPGVGVGTPGVGVGAPGVGVGVPGVGVRTPGVGVGVPGVGVGTPGVGVGVPGVNVRPDLGVGVGVGVGNNNLNVGGRARISSQSLGGNTISLGTHNINLGGVNYRPASHYHDSYHGYWNGNYGFGGSYPRFYGGGYGPGWGWGLGNYGVGVGYGYGYRPLGWGLGAWGLGALNYTSGYLGYYNPYCGSGAGFGYGDGYTYAQPIPVVYSSPTVVADQSQPSVDALDAAIAAFKQADYNSALNLVNQALTKAPHDSVLHEFRALVLFAQGDYQQAAATIHAVLAVGPGWDWTTMAGMYGNINLYTDQLRALEAVTKSNPPSGAPHFLLAYHYITIGETGPAAKQLQKVVAMTPDDRVAADILRMISAPTEAAPAPATAGSSDRQAPPPEPTPVTPDLTEKTPAPTPIDPATLVGTWKAAREEGSTFELTLAADSTFVWKFTPPKQATQEFQGTYKVDANILALERKDGGSLVAEVSPTNPKSFNFKLVGAPPQDKGLNFNR